MTKIEWVRDKYGAQGKTWNPVTGCTPISPGCQNCYAASIANRFWGDRKFSDIRLHKDRLDQSLKWKKPRNIFVCSMSDLFLEIVPMDFILKVFDRMEQAKQHTFMLLTKRPERVLKFCQRYGIGDANSWPQNVRMGVTAENQKTADERIPILLKIPASVRFVSVEPMLEQINLDNSETSYLTCNGVKDDEHCCESHDVYGDHFHGIDWVICGSESGQGRRPAKIEWIRDLRDQCITAGVPFFLKQMEIEGKLVKMPKIDNKIWAEYPK